MKSGERLKIIFKEMTDFTEPKFASWNDISFLISEIRRKDEALKSIKEKTTNWMMSGGSLNRAALLGIDGMVDKALGDVDD